LLSILGLAFTVSITTLNEDFVNSQIDKLNIADIADIADEAIDEQLEEEEIPRAVRDSLYNILPQLEQYIADESSIIIDQVLCLHKKGKLVTRPGAAGTRRRPRYHFYKLSS
jgi:hypothetical protein